MKTPFEKAGFTADDLLTLKEGEVHFHFKPGDTFKLQEDDRSASPFFTSKSGYPDGVAVYASSLELASQAPAAEADGWIEWHGGECPVPEGTVVDVRYRDGSQENALMANRPDRTRFKTAAAPWWRNDRSPGDIIAYRLHQPQDANTRANDDRLDAAVGLYSTSEGEIEEANLNECIGQAVPVPDRWPLLADIHAAGIAIDLESAVFLADYLLAAGYRKQ